MPHGDQEVRLSAHPGATLIAADTRTQGQRVCRGRLGARLVTGPTTCGTCVPAFVRRVQVALQRLSLLHEDSPLLTEVCRVGLGNEGLLLPDRQLPGKGPEALGEGL